MSCAPICLFVFNRLEHTQETIKSLQKNELSSESDLYIFSDGPRNSKDFLKIEILRKFLRSVSGFRSIIIEEREVNLGLANSIINGVTKVLVRHDSVIVLEDDLVTSPYFLTYMNSGLKMYEYEKNVASIHGYVYPVEDQLNDTFFLKGADCWGWATWKSRWYQFEKDGKKLLDQLTEKKLINEFNFDNTYPYIDMLRKQTEGKNNSWAIRWYASTFLNNMYTLYPSTSLVQNIGNDNSGTHCSFSTDYKIQLAQLPIDLKKIHICRDEQAFRSFKKYFLKLKGKRYKRAFRKIKQIFWSAT